MSLTSSEDQSSPDRIKESVSGYEGYAEVQNRNTSDTHLRKYFMQEFDEMEKALAEYTSKVREQNDPKLYTPLEKLQKKFSTVGDSMRNPTYCDSTFFQKPDIDDDTLQQIYLYENLMFEEIENLISEISVLKNSVPEKEELMDHVLRISDTLDALNQALFERESLLAGDMEEFI